MNRTIRNITGAVAAAVLMAPGDARAQNGGHAPLTDELAAPAPFGPGERMTYKVKLGVVTVGDGHMTVEGVDTVRGHPSYHLTMGVHGSAMFGLAKVDDNYDSWLDTRLLASRRFIRDVHQVNYKSRRVFEIYPEEKRWERLDADKDGVTLNMLPLDEISFVYFLRTLPLEVGASYEFNRYFKDDGNPVTVRVLRKEKVTVPAGTFDAIVVQPIIRTSGLFSEGGEAEVYLTDDAQRRVVYLRSKVPLVGSLSLHLESATDGVPLNPGSRGR